MTVSDVKWADYVERRCSIIKDNLQWMNFRYLWETRKFNWRTIRHKYKRQPLKHRPTIWYKLSTMSRPSEIGELIPLPPKFRQNTTHSSEENEQNDSQLSDSESFLTSVSDQSRDSDKTDIRNLSIQKKIAENRFFKDQPTESSLAKRSEAFRFRIKQFSSFDNSAQTVKRPNPLRFKSFYLEGGVYQQQSEDKVSPSWQTNLLNRPKTTDIGLRSLTKRNPLSQYVDYRAIVDAKQAKERDSSPHYRRMTVNQQNRIKATTPPPKLEEKSPVITRHRKYTTSPQAPTMMSPQLFTRPNTQMWVGRRRSGIFVRRQSKLDVGNSNFRVNNFMSSPQNENQNTTLPVIKLAIPDQS